MRQPLYHPLRFSFPFRPQCWTLRRKKIIYEDLTVHTLLVGGSGTKGLLQLYTEVIYSNRFISQQDYELIATRFEHVHRLQESLLLLQVEYYHVMEFDSEFILDLITTHQERIASQQEMLKEALPEDVVIDTLSNIMYYAAYPVGPPDGSGPNVLPQYRMPYRIHLVPTSELGEGFNTANLWNQEKKLGYSDWRMITPFLGPGGMGGPGGFLEGHNVSSTESVMRYLERHGWPPMLDEMVINYTSSDTNLHSIRSKEIEGNQVTQATSSLPPYRDYILLRFMQSNEPSRYYFPK